MDLFNFDPLLALLVEPQDTDQFNTWIEQTDVCAFLEEEILDEHIILYASIRDVFIHAVFIPNVDLDESDIQDLLEWQHNPYSSWSQCYSSDDVWIEPPLAHSGSKLLSKGEQIIFGRSFEGDRARGYYYELEQKIAQLLGIHFMTERQAWCWLNDHGDIEDVFKITKIDALDKRQPGIIISAQKQALALYAGLRETQLLRMFDIMRYRKSSFSGWNGGDESSLDNGRNIFGTLVVTPGYGSYSRGIQIADIAMSKKEIHRKWNDPDEKIDKKYATFIAQDWKNKEIKEISCDPSCLANYFTKSNLPFEITPAFFKPEVLTKYKSDTEKYKLQSRSVECRGAWYLKTFDINAAGQVHTYLIYLSHLPYGEQLHWKQYNERPKAPLSARAIKTDFEGRFYEEYDSLLSLKDKLSKLDQANVPWWKLRDRDAPDRVHYPFTLSKDEWAEEILNLDQLLVEGFQEKWLRQKAKSLGQNPDARLRSLKLIEECLIGIDFDLDHSEQIIRPFHEVHNLRSKLKGHTSGQAAETIRKNTLTKFGSFRRHFEHLCAECDESLQIIIEAFRDFE